MQNRKRKNDTSTDERPTKQPKLTNCIPGKYTSQHPHQIKLTNSIGSIICVDATPTNTVKRVRMTHVLGTADPRYNFPHPSTFARSIIPKLKGAVSAFQQKMIQAMIEKKPSMAFTIDGLDCRDEDKSAVYSFTIYFHHGEKVVSEVITFKALAPPSYRQSGQGLSMRLFDRNRRSWSRWPSEDFNLGNL